MVLIDSPLTATQVLEAFRHDEPYLFLGSAFLTVGIVSIALCLLRRRFDALLVWLGIFAGIYGLRMWMQAHVMFVVPATTVFLDRLPWAIDFLVPIPALFFFRAARFLRRGANLAVVAGSAVFLCIFAAALVFGPLALFYKINAFLVIGMLIALALNSLFMSDYDRGFAVVRVGLLSFVALALWDNFVPLNWLPKAEPYGFAILLGCLGYVAARRTLARDVELGEIQKELELARRIQLSILPGAFPESADFRVAARYVPMTAVAGDLYDFLVTGDRQAGLLIADVSGHGVPAALIASMVKMAATSQRANAAHPAALLAGMNAALCGNTLGQFVTAAYAHLDATTRTLRYSAAGHPAMLLLRHGAATEVAENGLLLAAAEDATYADKALPLEPCDRLLLYTDGLVEARNAAGDLFGEAALSAALESTAGQTADQAADGIVALVKQWAKVQDDDLTVLVCDFVEA
jgi:sigma-B regulation protein RsbU (phosphoserine phosphatase)